MSHFPSLQQHCCNTWSISSSLNLSKRRKMFLFDFGNTAGSCGPSADAKAQSSCRGGLFNQKPQPQGRQIPVSLGHFWNKLPRGYKPQCQETNTQQQDPQVTICCSPSPLFLPSVSSTFLKEAVTAPAGTSTSDSQTPHTWSHHHLVSRQEIETGPDCASLSCSF